MSKMRIVALVGAVIFALMAGLMARRLTAPRQAAEAPAVPTVQTTDVLVATKDLMMGDKLADAVTWRAWPKDSVLPAMVTKDAKPEALKDMATARVRLALFKDEPILEKKIVQPGAGGFMSAILPKGMRAKAIAISNKSAAGGFILPNDRVDVILTRKQADARISGAAVSSETVITNVRVLAVNQVYKQATEGDQATVDKGETATLELTPQQSEIVSTVETSGDLSIILRSLAENDGKKPEEVQPELTDKYAGRADRKRGGNGDLLFIRDGIQSYASQ